jgi:hypothetical protein
MPCSLCMSRNQTEFPAEVNIHFISPKNLNIPGVLAFPKVLICMDCGASWFTLPERELRELKDGIAASAAA